MRDILPCFFPFISVFHFDINSFPSDHKNPETAVKQILAVAPILPGQKQASPKPSEPVPKQSEEPPQNTNSLIDFGGDNDTASPAKATTSAASQGLLDSNSDDNRQSNTGGQATNLMAPLQPTLSPQGVKRSDSKNSGVDEFVDAQS